ncbi:hypothetical protein JR316_0010202 [Psilocybe cubensis]|uniref:Uncharacterized protein n=1 Tax=Psilocybe cubensis TaxID=181762 RepID=A0ACB8GQV9_PSICU|nr:hypothetical protein JR316_0010202 [Psilocybe cubensis]KAH9477969.1 hypothetical protein JR316_0010202 [Psilocybe cubensis]
MERNKALAWGSPSVVRVYGLNNITDDSGVTDPNWECFIDNISIGRSLGPSTLVGNYWTMCEHHQLVDGFHYLTLNATVVKGQTCWIDEIQYISSYMDIDSQNADIYVDNLDPAFEFSQGWGDFEGFVNTTNTNHASVSFPFTGVSVEWYAYVSSSPSIPANATYSVDNEDPVTFLIRGDPQANKFNQLLFRTRQYTPGPHVLSVTYLGDSTTTPLTLDWLIVQNITNLLNNNGNSNLNEPESPAHSKVGPIVGGVLGGLVIIGVITAALFYTRRRKAKKQKQEEGTLLDIDADAMIQPFRLSPSVPTGSVGNSIGTYRLPQINMATANSSKLSLDHSLLQPSSVATEIKDTPLVSTGRIDQRMPTAQGRLETPQLPSVNGISNSTPSQPSGTSLRRQNSLPSVPAPNEPQVAISNSGTPRMIVHEDSGLRLQRESHGSVLEVPPMYTAG